ncbi:MAG: hypothetical protein RQ739_08780 [Desulfotignum sp.]|nr:hypothetical protein [Desulfotignum sp.]
MKTSKRILLYGKSVILGSIGACLGSHPQLEVTKLVAPLKEEQKPKVAQTDIILFDLETTHPEAILSLQAALDKEEEQTAINLLNDLIAEAWNLMEDTEIKQDQAVFFCSAV